MRFVWSLPLSVQFLFLYSVFSFTVVFTSTSFSLTHHPIQCHKDESHALLQFKEGFPSYDNPKTESWNASTDCCSWDGIECDESTGHVIGIYLSFGQLYGSMDANNTLFGLLHLQHLDLSGNDFKFSQIPSRIGDFSHLRHLNLSYSNFFGEIPPQVSQLSNLLSLDISCYKQLHLKESILRSLIKNSTKLEVLLLSQVDISSPVPDILTNLTSLQELDLSHCGLYGEFPVGIFHLPNLRNLVLSENQNLTGRLPDFQANALSMLELDFTGFYGTLPASIGRLSSLEKLSIRECNFFGSIPSSLGNLTKLTYIGLGYNKFRGNPSASLENVAKLSHLDIGHNEFTIETISWIGKLSSLIYLDISSLNIDSGIPQSFANLSQLEAIYASNSNLTGEVPNSFFTLENLEYISLENNLLQGNLRLANFIDLKNLRTLDLSFNNLSFRSGITYSTDSVISALRLSSCNLVEFPEVLEFLVCLHYVDVSNNSISSLPSWLWGKVSLGSLTVSHNTLSGEISPSICHLATLKHLDLSFNNLSGKVPSCLGNVSQFLQTLVLKGNRLSGPIPQTYLIGNTLRMIDYSNNKLYGQLPRALVNCGSLEYFDVSHNNINDSFPFWLGALPELKVLSLSYNEFHGAIRCPWNMTCTFSKLHIIVLSHNKFSGSFPSDMIQSWKSMKAPNTSQLRYEYWVDDTYFLKTGQYFWKRSDIYSFTMSNKGMTMVYERLQQFYNFIAIDISSNQLSGEIPKVLGELKGLVLLNLSNNMLTGSIPSSLRKLSTLEALDLSLNSLSGEIPQQLTELTFLEFLNVSFNHLTGRVPQNKQFSTFSANSFEGNQDLCGDQLLQKCSYHAGPSFDPPSASDGDHDSGSFTEFEWIIVSIGFAGGLVAGVALGSTYSLQILRWLKRVF